VWGGQPSSDLGRALQAQFRTKPAGWVYQASDADVSMSAIGVVGAGGLRRQIAPPQPKEGLYKLTATISHSPTGDPKKLSEMFGYAESTPIDIRKTVVETN
jgi:hypothetical protein